MARYLESDYGNVPIDAQILWGIDLSYVVHLYPKRVNVSRNLQQHKSRCSHYTVNGLDLFRVCMKCLSESVELRLYELDVTNIVAVL